MAVQPSPTRRVSLSDGRNTAAPPAVLQRLVSDERLVEQVRADSERAFDVAYDRSQRGILAFCRHMLGSVEEADDAVQPTPSPPSRPTPRGSPARRRPSRITSRSPPREPDLHIPGLRHRATSRMRVPLPSQAIVVPDAWDRPRADAWSSLSGYSLTRSPPTAACSRRWRRSHHAREHVVMVIERQRRVPCPGPQRAHDLPERARRRPISEPPLAGTPGRAPGSARCAAAADTRRSGVGVREPVHLRPRSGARCDRAPLLRARRRGGCCRRGSARRWRWGSRPRRGCRRCRSCRDRRRSSARRPRR
jgi:hypothetical protein